MNEWEPEPYEYFAGAGLLPSQYFDQIRTEDPRFGPERRLMLAVLMEAIHRLMDKPTSVKRRVLRYEAVEWINVRDSHECFSFVSICEAFDIEPDWLRPRLFELKAVPLIRYHADHPGGARPDYPKHRKPAGH